MREGHSAKFPFRLCRSKAVYPPCSLEYQRGEQREGKGGGKTKREGEGGRGEEMGWRKD